MIKIVNSIIFCFFAMTYSKEFCVVIDAGHGGMYDGCTSVNGLIKEKDASLDVALRLASALDKLKIKNILTRSCDKHLNDVWLDDLADRIAIAKKHNADLFISIHFNSIANNSVRGFEIYVNNESKYALNSYIAASFLHKAMSLGVDKDLVRKVNSRDRGIRAADFVVIKDNVCPSVLLELDFLSNKYSEELVVQGQYREKLAQILLGAIIDYKKYLKS